MSPNAVNRANVFPKYFGLPSPAYLVQLFKETTKQSMLHNGNKESSMCLYANYYLLHKIRVYRTKAQGHLSS